MADNPDRLPPTTVAEVDEIVAGAVRALLLTLVAGGFDLANARYVIDLALTRASAAEGAAVTATPLPEGPFLLHVHNVIADSEYAAALLAEVVAVAGHDRIALLVTHEGAPEASVYVDPTDIAGLVGRTLADTLAATTPQYVTDDDVARIEAARQ